LLKKATVVDVTLIAAPPSTKNKERKRDPEMSSTKKGNQWYFGMKAHIGADADSGLVNSLIFTKAKVPDKENRGREQLSLLLPIFGFLRRAAWLVHSCATVRHRLDFVFETTGTDNQLMVNRVADLGDQF